MSNVIEEIVNSLPKFLLKCFHVIVKFIEVRVTKRAKIIIVIPQQVLFNEWFLQMNFENRAIRDRQDINKMLTLENSVVVMPICYIYIHTHNGYMLMSNLFIKFKVNNYL